MLHQVAAHQMLEYKDGNIMQDGFVKMLCSCRAAVMCLSRLAAVLPVGDIGWHMSILYAGNHAHCSICLAACDYDVQPAPICA